MIARIKIKDYMAHKDTELELSAGVTVLTGPNNSGKSAVVEALRSVAQNPPPHHVIRHGATKAMVRVELDSGEAVEWVRSRGNTIYRLFKLGQDADSPGETPEIYAKFGRTPPEDIRTLLRLDLVETETGAVDIHIGNQRYPIFLLDQTGSQAASFFAASTEAEYLLRVQQALKTKTGRAKSKQKELLLECAELDEALKLYLPLQDLDLALSTTEALYARLVALQQALPFLQQTLGALQETRSHYVRKVTFLAALESLSAPPQIHETANLEQTLQGLQGILVHLGQVVSGAEALRALASPPEVHTTAHLDAIIEARENNLLNLNRRRLAESALEPLEPAPVLHEIRHLEETTRNIEYTGTNRKRVAATESVLGATMAPPQTKAVAPLLTLIEQWAAGARSLSLYSSREGALESLHDPPELHHRRSIEELVASLGDVQSRLQNTRRLNAILTDLPASPEPQPVAGGNELLTRLTVLRGQFDANTRLQEELGSTIAKKRREIEQVIQDLGLCPLCGQTLDMEHFLEATHG